MQFSTIATILSAAMAVTATPLAGGWPSSGSGGDSSSTCAKGSDVSCCSTDSSGSDALGNVLGGSCVLSQLLGLLDTTCPAGNTFCCPTNQDGTLNIALSCIPINL
ncbi:hypothetical protein M409DRAFT_22698 [Zasmidium cellare ATCC 36951]|uniref:Hydrophobin n=1 Tax=Zasmidium cellare ATCC 36951 TaxID=1080233 RepID=A0A6A6CJP8_ZASCE|nr:uncharacterized protein M409DRAFT_22698 [Zasmidium cellare ATCC 36951]KAF2167271.1 hypothetical protein M409DRAFT_22698 [Zasmidium cellare ATCC 36951]